MSLILVDTSAWVEFDRATGSVADRRLTDLIAAGGPIATTEPVVMEVVAGAKTDARERDLRNLLGSFRLLRFDPVIDFDAAALIYRTCRGAGITPRGMIDCMIASIAIRHEATLLHADADLYTVANVMGIGIDTTAPSSATDLTRRVRS